jgi:hypothetical protein
MRIKSVISTLLGVLVLSSVVCATSINDLVRKYDGHVAVALTGIDQQLLSNSNVFFVDSGATNAADQTDGEHGNTWAQPFATVSYAVTKCTANNGDVILVAPGHTETLDATAHLLLAYAGTSVIGVGTGTDRPKFTVTYAAGAAIKVTAANCLIRNCRILCGVDSAVNLVDVRSTDFWLDKDYFGEGGTDADMNGVGMVDANSADAAANRLKITNCEFYAPTTGIWVDAINVGKDFVGVTIQGNVLKGYWITAAINVPTAGNAQRDLLIKDNVIQTDYAAAYPIYCQGTGDTGSIVGNIVSCDSKATSIAFGGCAGAGLNTWARNPARDDISLTTRSAHVTTTTPASATIFTVKGGPVVVTSLVGIVNNALATGFGNLKLQFDPDASGLSASDVCANIAAGSAAIGNTFKLGGQLITDAMVKGTTGFGYLNAPGDPCESSAVSLRLLLPPGVLNTVISGTADTGDIIDWYIMYEPLTVDARIDPAS